MERLRGDSVPIVSLTRLLSTYFIFIIINRGCCLTVNNHNYRQSFNPCHHNQSIPFQCTHVCIEEVAFDPVLTMEALRLCPGLIPPSALLIPCQSQPRAFTLPAMAFPASAHACVYTGCSNLMQIKQIQFGG